MHAWHATTRRLRRRVRHTSYGQRAHDMWASAPTTVHAGCTLRDVGNSMWSSSAMSSSSSSDMQLLLPCVDAAPVAPLGTPRAMAEGIAAFYEPRTYAYAIFDLPTIRRALRQHGEDELLGLPSSLSSPQPSRLRRTARSVAAAAALHVSPLLLLERPATFASRLGTERSARLSRVLRCLLDELDAPAATADDVDNAVPASLPRCCARLVRDAAACAMLVRLLRGLCVCSALRHPFALQFVHVLDALVYAPDVAGDHAWRQPPSSSSLPLLPLHDGHSDDRASVLSQLLLCAAEEFGSEAVLLAGLTLATRHRSSSSDDDDTSSAGNDVRMSRQCMRCFMRAERRQLDWQLKASPSTAARLHYTPAHGW